MSNDGMTMHVDKKCNLLQESFPISAGTWIGLFGEAMLIEVEFRTTQGKEAASQLGP